MSCIQEQPTEGSASKCQGKWPDQTLDQAFGLPEVLVAVSTSPLSCKRAGKTRTLIPVWDSSGESRFRRAGQTRSYHSIRLRVHLNPLPKGRRRDRAFCRAFLRVPNL